MGTCPQCTNSFEAKKSSQKFCGAKCKAKHHRMKPFTKGVPVRFVKSTTIRGAVEVTLRVDLLNREQLAKISFPSNKLYLVPVQEDFFE